MNKYQESLNKIRNIVLDESGDGYYTQRYLQDFYSNACGTLQELVDKADSLEWAILWFQMSNDAFANIYGFNFNPHKYPNLYEIARKEVYGNEQINERIMGGLNER